MIFCGILHDLWRHMKIIAGESMNIFSLISRIELLSTAIFFIMGWIMSYCYELIDLLFYFNTYVFGLDIDDFELMFRKSIVLFRLIALLDRYKEGLKSSESIFIVLFSVSIQNYEIDKYISMNWWTMNQVFNLFII